MDPKIEIGEVDATQCSLLVNKVPLRVVRRRDGMFQFASTDLRLPSEQRDIAFKVATQQIEEKRLGSSRI